MNKKFHLFNPYCLIISSCLLALLQPACSPIPYQYVRNNDALKQYITILPKSEIVETKDKKPTKPLCENLANYAPDSLHPEHSPIRWVRLNAHIMDSTDSMYNFKQKDAAIFVHDVLKIANKKLNENKQMHLPYNNHTPVLPPRFQWLLSGASDQPNDKGIYHHYDNDLFWVNKKGPGSFHSRNICDKYSVYNDSIINVFFVEHHPDSCKSKTYRATQDGIGYSNCVKVISAYYLYQSHRKNNDDKTAYDIAVESIANLLNHELGHSLGLSHSWIANDGCDDTPVHKNCWNYNEGENCETEVSNNIMDYNAYRTALTPCQIGKVLYNLTQTKQKQHAFVKPTWCDYDPSASIYIQKGDTVTWKCLKDLNGDLIIRTGGQLTIKCGVSMPPNSRIVVESDATLILDACSITQRCAVPKPWQGIELQCQKMKPKPRLIVLNGATIQTFKENNIAQ